MRGLVDGGRDAIVRAAEKSDLAAVQSIYGDEVLHGSASFELEPPTLEKITARWASVLSFQLPYLVAIKDDRIAGSTPMSCRIGRARPIVIPLSIRFMWRRLTSAGLDRYCSSESLAIVNCGVRGR